MSISSNGNITLSNSDLIMTGDGTSTSKGRILL
jgi:hypothetical protein